ncbi:DUF6176 family protein [Lacticaseibacillus saniviri]|uniref:Uncharacterized protein n=1 Tax=Lacticaseibacillus saniviri JCM 17471 = DSM 24301 TaxID=1293598 RepID=A0A0R2N508_9LACO|nr:DUF6176 family protein [Lacticaseibacillus saniviri]KRO18154.1 hypothetical protein IV56_GL001282 [Lacticaseibacillus saniviri JCM 17471 = DSM 24301]MCG4282592.1 DUF6176 family protein [Lacticaseibacillus saniviri]
MLIDLEGFAVYPDKIDRAKEWMQYLRSHQAEVDATLIPEHMQLEHIFSINFAGRFYLCWYSNQTAMAPDVTTSSNPVDIQHVKFWQECIDEHVPSLKSNLENTFQPPENA